MNLSRQDSKLVQLIPTTSDAKQSAIFEAVTGKAGDCLPISIAKITTMTIVGRQFEEIAQEVPLSMTKSPPQRAGRDESLRV